MPPSDIPESWTFPLQPPQVGFGSKSLVELKTGKRLYLSYDVYSGIAVIGAEYCKSIKLIFGLFTRVPVIRSGTSRLLLMEIQKKNR